MSKYKYYRWINPTKAKGDIIKKHDGDTLKMVNTETGKIEEIVFIELSEAGDFEGFKLYTGEKVPFKTEITHEDREISQTEYQEFLVHLYTLRDMAEMLFSQQVVDEYNEYQRKRKEEEQKAREEAMKKK
jgi:hypothetical protein